MQRRKNICALRDAGLAHVNASPGDCGDLGILIEIRKRGCCVIF